MNKHVSRLVALALVCVAYFLARYSGLTSAETSTLASRFHFNRVALPEVANPPPHKAVRRLHPSLERISAWVSSLGASATLADLDGDGLANDLVQVDPRTDLVTVLPVPGTGGRYRPFVLNCPFWAGRGYDLAAMAPMGTLAGDFNEDGLIDILVYFWGRTPVLYLRNADASSTAGAVGGERATSRPAALSLAAFIPCELVESGERWFSNAAVQADFDGDGHVDLVVGNYWQDGSQILDTRGTGTVVMHEGKARALNGGYKHFLLWQGATLGATPSVRYQEVRHLLADEVIRGWTLALGAADLDGDLLPELYIANDFGPDRLLHNRSTPGQLRFALVEGRRDFLTPKSCVLGRDSFKGMGVDFGDLNGDGLPDIFVSNVATRFGLTESYFLWLSTGDTAQFMKGVAPYVHGIERLGLARSGFAWEARLADFDNDGVLEAMQACGFIRGKINRWPELQALGTSNSQIVHDPRLWPSFRPGADLSGADCNPFFVRGSDGRYHDIAPAIGLGEPLVSRGIAIADVDGDGRLDFVTANQWGPSYVFRNESSHPGAFLGLRITHPNGSPLIGAVARVHLPDGRNLLGQVDGGSGHSGHRSPEVHFGLGALPASQRVEVDLAWRDRAGRAHRRSLQMTPGWHTLRLGADEAPVQALR
jgi:hypothetical protein